MFGGTSIGFSWHQLFSFKGGRHGLAVSLIPKCLLSSRLWVMKSTREKEQHRRSAFRKRGFYRCYLIGRILEISLGGGQDRDERCLLRQLVSLMGRNLGNYGELVEFLVLSRCCIEREQKRFTFAHSFSLYHLGTAYIFVLFLFSCSWLGLQHQCWPDLFLGPE